MSRLRLPSLVLGRPQLVLILLLLVALYAGYAVGPTVYFSLFGQKFPSVEELRQETTRFHWRLYGGALPNSSDGNGRGEQRLNGSRGAELFAVTSRDARVRKLVKQLHSLPVSCQSRPQSDRRVLGERYAKFLAALANYTEFHERERRRGDAKRLLWVCDGCGGLADRIRGITYALVLAMFSRRVLLLDWRHGQGLSERAYLEPNLVNWRLTAEEKQKAYAKDSHHKYIRTGMVLGSHGEEGTPDDVRRKLEVVNRPSVTWILITTNMRPSTLANDTKTASLEWVKRGMTGLGLDKLPPQEIDMSLVGLAFRYLFKFSFLVLREVEAASRVLGLRNMAYVGLHVRTGFEGSKQHEKHHPKLYDESWQWDKSLACAHRYTTQHLGEGTPVFLATDSRLVKNMTLPTYAGQIRCLDNSVAHLDKLRRLHHKTEEFVVESLLSVWVELVLLAGSHSLVKGESGYAMLAQSLCFIPRTRTINELTCEPLQMR